MMLRSEFRITKMDCPSEANLIRLKLGDFDYVESLEFDLDKRKLFVYHHGDVSEIVRALETLKLDSELIHSKDYRGPVKNHDVQKRTLWTVLIINFSFFLIELIAGLISGSMGLAADSLDMLADAIVYGLSLSAVGGTLLLKKRVAKLAGYLQLGLAALGLTETLRRFFYASFVPDFETMIIISTLALIANSICLYLLQKSAGKDEAHMKASVIFTSNDIIINIGVISAGILVNALNSITPDLIIGIIVFVLVIQGAIRILKLGN